MIYNTYNINWLLNQINQNIQIKYLFFWGHTNNTANAITSSCLSQWYPASFNDNELIYLTAEHWMMAKKAELFDDMDIFNKIIQAQSAAEAKKLGRKVKNFKPEIWEQHKFNIVCEGNILKFSQNKELKKFLLNTQNRILVEASPVDDIWGIGMPKDHKDVENPTLWKGQNLLGFALMEVRDILK